MRNFAGFPAQAYIGQTFSKPIKLQGIAGSSCPLIFNWLSYGAATARPNITVNIDMSSQLVAKSLGLIRSVYIDNMGSDVPIYIVFPDTGYTVVAQPNSAGWFPCYTNGLQCQVVGAGFFDGDIPTTFVLFTNIAIPAQTDIEIATAISLWKASNTITRGSTILNTNLGVPSLGDQTINFVDTPAAAGVIRTNLWNTPLPGGFIYLNNVFFSGIWTAATTGDQITYVLESTGSAGVLYNLSVACQNGIAQTVLSLNGMNVKLDATQTWRLRVTHVNASASMTLFETFVWTFNPQ